MTTTRTVAEGIRNVLDYLLNADIAAYISPVSEQGTRVSWHATDPGAPFLVGRGDPTLEDYQRWVRSGAYSAILFDGSLLQITYEVEEGEVSGHRLAYVPCPYRLDRDLVRQEPILDVVDLHVAAEPTNMVLHSAIRFDFDPGAAAPGHPAAHLTINSADCRIACAAPMHIGRFTDFIFRHFYPDLWQAHLPFFSRSSTRDAGARTLTDDERNNPHLFWG
ncbi:DUF2290 domain-containing protein [Streptomyces sp. NRRL S-1824]|uniref:DUF2290 domain-containing protein n=1 Tax=Streptomyces sp. NRRL S-1824 TaxID=1463889 RepID=UPI0004C55841|nr:DUF2290 domain-containing protein [Streptomyces sp. NRRL S-1824]